jgi:hypothetical protein
LCRYRSQLLTVAYVQFPQNVAQMNFDGVLRDDQGIGDFPVGHAINYQRDYLPLPLAQRVEEFLQIIALIQPLNQLLHYFPRDNNVPLTDHI